MDGQPGEPGFFTGRYSLDDRGIAAEKATDGDERSVRNMAGSSLGTDTVFSDGHSPQLATVTGTVDAGMTATLTVPV